MTRISRTHIFVPHDDNGSMDYSRIKKGKTYLTESELNREDTKKVERDIREMKNTLDKMDRTDPGYRLQAAEYERLIQLWKEFYSKNGRAMDKKQEVEKIRKNVSKAINTARERIKIHIPELYDHLDCIKKGDNIIYHPLESIEWQTTPTE